MTPIPWPPVGAEPAVVPPAAPVHANGTGRPGDDALIATFNLCRDELVSTLLYLLGNQDDAQDAAQEAFLKCWRARQSVPDVLNLRAWIFRVGLNAAKDYQRSAWNRKSRPLPEDEVMMPGRDDAPGRTIEEQETLDRLRVAITQLRQDEKEVFLLRQNGELTYEQIAEVRNAPVGTVKTQMRTALIKLRKVLNPNGASGEE
ncbi:RNA polymerase sigma factor [Gemmata sp.]|uniref:RNA polymerase sigma factor n=1 Tax=Gemmata sp. TaxID=1914242 RepID=UPI003F72001A